MAKTKFNYDYSKILWMKMFLAKPDFPNNESEVLINFEQALEIIKEIDNITQGIQKIIYLVGWQGLGHDDCYPEMDVINPFLKRYCDKTAKESTLIISALQKTFFREQMWKIRMRQEIICLTMFKALVLMLQVNIHIVSFR